MNKLNNTKTINYIYQQQNNNTALCVYMVENYLFSVFVFFAFL